MSKEVDNFMSNLGGMLEQQFLIGENKLDNLNLSQDGHFQKYGKLGDFADRIDQSADRQWLEAGYSRLDQFNIKSNNLEVLMQEPTATVFVKKRAFSSLAENYRIDLSDEKERLFIRATKILFQNKTNQIAAFEKLTKIESISSELGRVDYNLLPIIFEATDAINSGLSLLSPSVQSAFGKFKNITDRVRQIVSLSQVAKTSTWITNVQNMFKTNFGEGTGVIELTNITNINTTVSTNFGQGNCSLTIEDPYNLMTITNIDIDKALADATNIFYNRGVVQLGTDAIQETIQNTTTLLNQSRKARGANKIIFIANPDALLDKRLRALVDIRGQEILFNYGPFSETNGDIGTAIAAAIGTDSSGSSLNLDASAKLNSELLGNDGLNENEIAIFSQLVALYFNLMQIQANSKSEIKDFNQDPKIKYVRNKLRLHYGNKLIIQPMDVVHIYMESKSKVDDKITGGLKSAFNALGFLQTADNIVADLRNSFDILEDHSIEKSVFVGNDFPNWLWMMLRNQFVKDASGTHVFAGVVSQAKATYSGGFSRVSVSCQDNTSYFNFGIVNFKPSVDVFNGSLYDPLTPFDLQFDSITGVPQDDPQLLDENKKILNSAFIKYKSGAYVGRIPTEKNFQQDAKKIKNNVVNKVYYDPDGFVYKWKEGIGSLTLSGREYSDKNPNDISGITLTKDEFAGQDVMNVLSLLITGQPYNFITYYDAASQVDSYSRDPNTQQDPSVSYYKTLESSLKYRNLIYGNFIPFKKLTINQDAYKNMVISKLTVDNFNNQLNDKLKERASLSDAMIASSNAEDKNNANTLAIQIQKLDEEIQKLQSDILKSISSAQSSTGRPYIDLIGNEVVFDYDTFENDDKNRLSSERYKELIRKNNLLTRRLAWRVRSNEDINLFIVDDIYDKDYDIQAFETSFISSPEIWKSEYATVGEKIRTVAALLDLEIFADTQGNIQVRPPQYNKIPSSVFYRMIRLKNDFGIELYPKFLEDLYSTQITGLLSKIEVIEDEIRLFGLMFGKGSDKDLEEYINSENGINGGDVKFKFVSYEGYVPNLDAFKKSSDPDYLIQGGKLDTINQQSQLSSVFNTVNKYNLLSKDFYVYKIGDNDFKYERVGFKQIDSSALEEKIKNRLFSKTGQYFDIKQFINQKNNINKTTNQVSNSDLLEIFQQISIRISERQKLLKIASKSLRHLKEATALSSNKEDFANKMLAPNINSSAIPESFQHMIEYEDFDDYGPDAGKRYVIKNHQIINMEIYEESPPYTAVEVEGRMDLLLEEPSLTAFNTTSSGLSTAAAVDYDLWRMYGIKIPQSVSAPYLHNAETQCAPFAVALLNKARKEILKGSLTIAGNEYMQPGEVIYIEDKDLLFYVESVSHTFSFGNFTTNLNLSYGHNVGEYIPTKFDIIGKTLYKNKEITKFIHNRQDDVNNQEYVGTIVGSFDSNNPSDILTKNIFASSNIYNLQKIIESAKSTVPLTSDTTKVILELRIFYNSYRTEYKTVSSTANSIASEVEKLLKGNALMLTDSLKPLISPSLKEAKVQVQTVDTSPKKKDFRYPSRQAYALARQIINNRSSEDDVNAKNIDQVIYNYIVDCWVYFKEVKNSSVS